jgi:hypothetical protein
MLGKRLLYIKRLASSVRNLNEEEREIFENQLEDSKYINIHYFGEKE